MEALSTNRLVAVAPGVAAPATADTAADLYCTYCWRIAADTTAADTAADTYADTYAGSAYVAICRRYNDSSTSYSSSKSCSCSDSCISTPGQFSLRLFQLMHKHPSRARRTNMGADRAQEKLQLQRQDEDAAAAAVAAGGVTAAAAKTLLRPIPSDCHSCSLLAIPSVCNANKTKLCRPR